MLTELFEELTQELRGAMVKRKHPFKYITLTTVGDTGMPRSRTVVLREVDESLNGIIFTDARTVKVEQLKRNPNACILAYHPKKMLQLRLNGRLIPINSDSERKRLFHKVSGNSLKDYTTTQIPGSTISNPDEVEYGSRDKNHFLPLRFEPETIEYLRLKRPNHLRALFSKENHWKGQWLVP